MNLLTVSDHEYTQKTITDLQYENETIENKKFDECVFKKCHFISCEIKNCIFIDCIFEDCVLSADLPTNSRFIDVSFKNSKIIGIDWTKAKELRNLIFKKSSVDYCNFRFLEIKGIKIEESTAVEADFTEAKMQSSTLTGTDFEKAIFFKTDLTKSDFRNSKNYNIDPLTNKLKEARFSYPEAINLLIHLDIKVDY